MTTALLIRAVVAISVAAISVGCSAETAPSETDDGRFRPEPNGTRIGEDQACDILLGALQQRAADLGCVTTSPTCPNFIRSLYGPECVEYDEGAAQGCADFYQSFDSCDALAPDSCVVKSYQGSEPSGCPG